MDKQNELPIEATEAVAAEPTQEKQKSRPVTRRYSKSGKRRGRYAYAAPLGVLISLLSIVGVVALIVSGIQWYQKANDTTELKEELYYYLEPVLAYTPASFTDANKPEQDAFLNAAVYRVIQAEVVRMQLEKVDFSKYSMSESDGRVAIPVKEIEASYAALFGPNAKLTHRSIEDSQITYGADGYYYVPFTPPATGYRAVVDYVKRQGDTYVVRVGYVPNASIRLDEHANEIEPTIKDAAHCQVYTLKKTGSTYYIAACKDE